MPRCAVACADGYAAWPHADFLRIPAGMLELNCNPDKHDSHVGAGGLVAWAAWRRRREVWMAGWAYNPQQRGSALNRSRSVEVRHAIVSVVKDDRHAAMGDVTACFEALQPGRTRIDIGVKVDCRAGPAGRLQSKTARIEERPGRKLHTWAPRSRAIAIHVQLHRRGAEAPAAASVALQPGTLPMKVGLAFARGRCQITGGQIDEAVDSGRPAAVLQVA